MKEDESIFQKIVAHFNENIVPWTFAGAFGLSVLFYYICDTLLSPLILKSVSGEVLLRMIYILFGLIGMMFVLAIADFANRDKRISAFGILWDPTTGNAFCPVCGADVSASFQTEDHTYWCAGCRYPQNCRDHAGNGITPQEALNRLGIKPKY
jgi:hypothetical protein